MPIDFTQAGDGFEPPDYGREALIEALIAAAPAAVALALAELPARAPATAARKSNAHILGFALAAGASDAFPVAGAVAVPMVQAAMLRQLAKLHGVAWDRRAYAEFAGALGAGTLVRTASDLRRAPARQAHPRLRPDGGRRRRGRRELRHHLRHGQGRRAIS